MAVTLAGAAVVPEYPMARAAGCPFDPLPDLTAQLDEGRLVKVLRLAAPVESLPFKHDGSVYGVYELPVTW
ncbi:hypothetical protein ACWKT3_01545 [Streptomyces violaceus]